MPSPNHRDWSPDQKRQANQKQPWGPRGGRTLPKGLVRMSCKLKLLLCRKSYPERDTAEKSRAKGWGETDIKTSSVPQHPTLPEACPTCELTSFVSPHIPFLPKSRGDGFLSLGATQHSTTSVTSTQKAMGQLVPHPRLSLLPH